MMEQGTEAGVFEEAEHDIVKSIFKLGDRAVSALMKPRREVVWLNLDDPFIDNQKKLASSLYSRFPVAQGTLEQVLGGDDGPATEVRAQDPERLTNALVNRGHHVQRAGDVLSVMGASPEQVGEIAGQEGVAVLGLAAKERSLEEAFFALTGATS